MADSAEKNTRIIDSAWVKIADVLRFARADKVTNKHVDAPDDDKAEESSE